MASDKYGYLVKKLNFRKAQPKGSGGPDVITWPKGEDLGDIDLSFELSYHNKTGNWGDQAHYHDFNEVLFFAPLDYNHPGELGAQLEIEMGPEGEKHLIDSPTAIAMPAGFVHTPLTTRRVDKTYMFLAISLNKGYKDNVVSRDAAKAAPLGNKYDPMVKKMEMRDLKARPMGGNADYMYAWNGRNMEGFLLNFTWAFHGDTGPWHGGKDPHVHPSAEALVFFGLDYTRPDYLGAEIEIAMGKEQEIHVINTPSIVIAPAGLVHCPLITRKVEKPYGFTAISLNPGHETTWLGKGKFPWEK
jgi:hypothetical protein